MSFTLMNRSTTISILLVNTKKTVETACLKTTWPTQNERFDREPLNSSQCCVSLIFHDSVTFMVPPSRVNIILRQGFSFSLEGTHHLLWDHCILLSFQGNCVDHCESMCNGRNFWAASETLHMGMSSFVQAAALTQDSLKNHIFFMLQQMFGPHGRQQRQT